MAAVSPQQVRASFFAGKGGSQASGLISAFLAKGGRVTRASEGFFVIDWARDTRFFKAARAASKLGHKRRRRKK